MNGPQRGEGPWLSTEGLSTPLPSASFISLDMSMSLGSIFASGYLENSEGIDVGAQSQSKPCSAS